MTCESEVVKEKMELLNFQNKPRHSQQFSDCN